MTGIERYARRDARLRETRVNEARTLLFDEIQGYKTRIAELEAENAALKAAKSPVETPQAAEPNPTNGQPEAATEPVRPQSGGKSGNKGSKK